MSYRQKKYPNIVRMIVHYEYKFKKQMTVQVLQHYISEAFNISVQTANDYIRDLVEMKYIRVEGFFIVRIDKEGV